MKNELCEENKNETSLAYIQILSLVLWTILIEIYPINISKLKTSPLLWGSLFTDLQRKYIQAEALP